MADDPFDDDYDEMLPPDEEGVFARDPLGRLVRVDAPTQADLARKVRIKIDGSDWFEVPKAVPATDAQGNVRYQPDGTTVVRPTTILDAARRLPPPTILGGGPAADGSRSVVDLEVASLSADQSSRSFAFLDVFRDVVRNGGKVARIPVVCHQDHLTPLAVCRICTVQIVSTDPRDPTKRREQRKLLPACQHRVEDGMEVHTLWSPEAKFRTAVRSSVQVLYELLTVDHLHPDRDAELRHRDRKYRNELAALHWVLLANWETFRKDATSPKERADQDRLLGAAEPRFSGKPVRDDLLVGWVDGLPDGPPRTREEMERMRAAPPFVVDHNSCVLCDRCIRACSEVKPFQVIGRTGKGSTTRIAFDLADVPMAESSCRACGECMTACPTGAISFQHRVMDMAPDRLEAVLSGDGRLAEAAPVEPNDLLDHPLFARLSVAYLEWNRGAVRRRPLRPGDVLAEEGEYGTKAFILEKGYLAVCRKGAAAPRSLPHADDPAVAAGLEKVPRRYGPVLWVQAPNPTDVTGEMSPMSHARRNASLVALTKGEVMEIDRNVLFVMLRDPENREVLDRRYAARALREFLPRLADQAGLFGALTREEIGRMIEAVAPTAQIVRADPGYVICREGEPADAFYLIRLGAVGVTFAAGGRTRLPLRQGDCFGEVAVLTRKLADPGPGKTRGVRTATCTALDHGELVRVGGDEFEAFYARQENAAALAKLRERCAALLRGDR